MFNKWRRPVALLLIALTLFTDLYGRVWGISAYAAVSTYSDAALDPDVTVMDAFDDPNVDQSDYSDPDIYDGYDGIYTPACYTMEGFNMLQALADGREVMYDYDSYQDGDIITYYCTLDGELQIEEYVYESGDDYLQFLDHVPFYYDDQGRRVFDFDWLARTEYGTEETILGIDDAAIIAVIAGIVTALLGYKLADSSGFVKKMLSWASTSMSDVYQSFMLSLESGKFLTSAVIAMVQGYAPKVSASGDTLSVRPSSGFGEPMHKTSKYYNNTAYQFVGTADIANNSSYSHIYYYDYYLPADVNYIGLAQDGSDKLLSYSTGKYMYSTRFYYMDGDDFCYTRYSSNACYTVYYVPGGYFSKPDLTYPTTNCIIYVPNMVACKSGLPYFAGETQLKSYFLYGTTGGLLNADYLDPDVYDLSANWSADVSDKIWSVTNDNLNLSDDEASALASSLESSMSYADFLSLLNVYLGMSQSSAAVSITDEDYYRMMQYLITSYAVANGASTVSGPDLDSVIDQLYETMIDGTSALADQAQESRELMRNFVVINGGKAPNDNDDDNKFDVKVPFVAAIIAALSALSIISTGDDVATVPDNVTEVEELPSTGTDDSNQTVPGVTDLSGIITLIKNLPNTFKGLFDSIVNLNYSRRYKRNIHRPNLCLQPFALIDFARYSLKKGILHPSFKNQSILRLSMCAD